MFTPFLSFEPKKVGPTLLCPENESQVGAVPGVEYLGICRARIGYGKEMRGPDRNLCAQACVRC